MNLKNLHNVEAVRKFAKWLVEMDYVNNKDMDNILKEWASVVLGLSKEKINKIWCEVK